MKTKMMGITKATARSVTKAVEGMLPEMRWLIESARHRAMTAANLAMVTLYWNIGRVITRDLQQNAKRGGYGERLLERPAAELAREYALDIRSAIYGTCGGFTSHSKFHSQWL